MHIDTSEDGAHPLLHTPQHAGSAVSHDQSRQYGRRGENGEGAPMRDMSVGIN